MDNITVVKDRNAISYRDLARLDHVHDSSGKCLKNRYGHRCAMSHYVATYSRPASELNPRSALFVVTEDENYDLVLQRAKWFADEVFNPPKDFSVNRGMVKIYDLTTLMIKAIITSEGAKEYNSFAQEFIPISIP